MVKNRLIQKSDFFLHKCLMTLHLKYQVSDKSRPENEEMETVT